MIRTFRLPVALLHLVACTIGCGTATIQTHDDRFEATIERADRERLCLDLGSGERFLVERKDITTIRHPGGTAGMVGLATVALGVAITMFAASRADRDPTGLGTGIV